MKPTCRYIVTAFLSASVFVANAKEGSTSYNSPVQFMQNKGQITDQHGAVRKDIDAKVEANGVVMFVGDGELHYQWQAPPDLPQGEEKDSRQVAGKENGVLSPWGRDREGLIYRMDVKLLGANKNAEVIFEEPTGYYENYYLAHTGESGVTARGYGRITYKNIYQNIDLVFYTERVSGASAPRHQS